MSRSDPAPDGEDPASVADDGRAQEGARQKAQYDRANREQTVRIHVQQKRESGETALDKLHGEGPILMAPCYAPIAAGK